MDHLDEGTMQALLDGELEDGAALLHLRECGSCTGEYRRLTAASAALSRALLELDVPARSASKWVAPRRAALPRRFLDALPRAAVVLLTVGAAASATVPGSPVREWLLGGRSDRAATVSTERANATADAPTVAAATAAPESTPEAGVSVAPAGGRLVVGLTSPAPELRIRATLTDGTRGGVFASGDAASARFTTSAGRIDVVAPESGELRVEIPRSAETAVIEVDGRRYLEKDGDQLRLMIAPGDSGAAEVHFQVEPR